MPTYAPDYYKDFACKAEACKHNCCIGWEIDIDPASLSRYAREGGEMGARLASHIAKAPCAHFIQNADGRCPFLNAQNLCDIILTLGEDALCDICKDHPRYRNFLPTRVEIGIGLACEEAARLILSGEGPYKEFLLTGEDALPSEEETLFFALRDGILELLFDETLSAYEALETIRAAYSLQKERFDPLPLYRGMPHLYPAWEDVLSGFSRAMGKMPDMPVRRLGAYFVHRHLAGGFIDGRWRARLAFCLHATEMICRLSPTPCAFLETARQYSEEIEYSEENLETLLSALSDI